MLGMDADSGPEASPRVGDHDFPTQQHEVYAWEEALCRGLDVKVPRNKARAATNALRAAYGLLPISVRTSPRYANSGYVTGFIEPYIRYRTERTHADQVRLRDILHETLHSVLDELPKPPGADPYAHGSVFARMLADLAERYYGIPLATSRHAAKRLGVRLDADPLAVPTPLDLGRFVSNAAYFYMTPREDPLHFHVHLALPYREFVARRGDFSAEVESARVEALAKRATGERDPNTS